MSCLISVIIIRSIICVANPAALTFFENIFLFYLPTEQRRSYYFYFTFLALTIFFVRQNYHHHQCTHEMATINS